MSEIQSMLDRFADGVRSIGLRDPDLQLRSQDDPNIFAIESEYHAIGIVIDPEAHAVHLTGFVTSLPGAVPSRLLRMLLALNAEAETTVQLVTAETAAESDVVELSRSYPATLIAAVNAYDLVSEFCRSVEILRTVISNWSEPDQPLGENLIFA